MSEIFTPEQIDEIERLIAKQIVILSKAITESLVSAFEYALQESPELAKEISLDEQLERLKRADLREPVTITIPDDAGEIRIDAEDPDLQALLASHDRNPDTGKQDLSRRQGGQA